ASTIAAGNSPTSVMVEVRETANSYLADAAREPDAQRSEELLRLSEYYSQVILPFIRDLPLKFPVKRKKGTLFEVEIPEDQEMLNWDKSLNEQNEDVQRAVRRLMPDLTGNPRGHTIYRELSRLEGGEKQASN